MSTLASSPTPQPSWKQEVNRRLAAHKNRKGLSVVEPDTTDTATNAADNAAARAAARVAARYAKAPSYSEMQAAEAKAALRAAEAATRVALEAQAAAQQALANLETADEPEAAETFGYAEPEQPGSAQSIMVDGPVEIRWEPDMPALHTTRETESQAWRDEAEGQRARPVVQAIEHVEAAQPIPANVVEFPRELVATRRMRPRLTGRETGGGQYAQLSIFEVEPGSISTDPEPVSASAPVAAGEPMVMPEWKAIELDELPLEDPQPLTASASTLHLAPLNLRLMAIVVDTALVAAVVVGLAALAGRWMPHLPTLKTAEIISVVSMVLFSAIYQYAFLTLLKMTPGMRFAQVSLCTFDDETPSVQQIRERLGATLLSLAPVGLGVLWALFDEDHMSWHDRLSRTYLRQG